MDEFTIELDTKDNISVKCEGNIDLSKDREEGEITEDEINENVISINCDNNKVTNNDIQIGTQYYKEFQGYTKKMNSRRYYYKFNMKKSTHYSRYSNYKQQHKEFFNHQRGVKNFSGQFEFLNHQTLNQKKTNFLLYKNQNTRSSNKISSFYESHKTLSSLRNHLVPQYSSGYIPFINNNFHNQYQDSNLTFQKTSFGPSITQTHSYLRNHYQNDFLSTSQAYKDKPLSLIVNPSLINYSSQPNDPTNNLQNSNINVEMSTKSLFKNTSPCIKTELIKEIEEGELRPKEKTVKILMKSEVKDEIPTVNEVMEEIPLINIIKTEDRNDCAEMTQNLISDTLSDCSVIIRVLRSMSIGEITGIMEKHEMRIKEFKWLNEKYQTACVTYFNRNIALQIYQQYLKKES
ncbi:uncharacterized protein LOC126901501 isoform X2 [Daktulosphaira vitifoliae]|uniref:uncharacterized protein LOC126901501 isoform X2 n=1 Tax=Daktulosphaira vitifoliae TaxID=58002 RepID=UPI0021A9CA11|nr:uncharacterized protein LOC126901501 isoform X2 [Daktulosphaira vitifoliae]